MKLKPQPRFRLSAIFTQAVIVVSLSLFLPAASNADQLGDVDLDGEVSFLDINPFIALLANGTYQFEADLDGDGAINFLDIDPFIDVLTGIPDDDPQLGVPLGIDFDIDSFVDFAIVDIKSSWLCDNDDYEFFLDIEITGRNGVLTQRGTQMVSVHDTMTFDVNGPIASVVVDWTTDMVPRNVNETYTVCVQVVRYDKQTNQFENIGELKCTDFGPF